MNRMKQAVLLTALAMAALPAGAQTPSNVQPQGLPANPNAKGAPRQPAPPALPGSRAEPNAVTPAERAASDLPPTEALFDAINRGDLATARDSVNRGADLNGVNVLGLTPLELAVDLGRNEISFLLLSLRGGSGYSTSTGPVASRPQTRAEKLAAARAEQAEARAARRTTAVAARPSAASTPQTARLFAGNGGAPVPQAGFLGFDAGR